jgi:hypothetical protein
LPCLARKSYNADAVGHDRPYPKEEEFIMRLHPLPGKSACLYSLFSAGLTLCMAAASVGAQTKPPVADTPKTKMPEVIRLEFRGKPGDTYKRKEISNEKRTFNLSVIDRHSNEQVQSVKNGVLHLRGRGPDNTLLLEVHNLGGKEERQEDGKKTEKAFPTADALFTLKPNLERIKAVPLEKTTARSSSPAAGKKGNGTKANVRETLKNAVKAFDPLPFPDKILHVGDTWTGKIPDNPYDAEAQEGFVISYIAKLQALEVHRDTPCAKVEYTITYKGGLPGEEKLILKDMPANTKIVGGVELSGTIMEYYSLDRGALIDSYSNYKLMMKYTLPIKNPSSGEVVQVNMDGGAEAKEHATATEFPPYDAALIPAIAASPTSAH